MHCIWITFCIIYSPCMAIISIHKENIPTSQLIIMSLLGILKPNESLFNSIHHRIDIVIIMITMITLFCQSITTNNHFNFIILNAKVQLLCKCNSVFSNFFVMNSSRINRRLLSPLIVYIVPSEFLFNSYSIQNVMFRNFHPTHFFLSSNSVYLNTLYLPPSFSNIAF